MTGRIIKQISNDYTILSNNKLYICKARGKFRNMNISPLVGDIVNFDKDNLYILEVLLRKNYLVRPPISNVDIALIITSVKDPNFSTNLLDKLLVIIEYNNIKPVIIFTKLDLLNESEYKEINNYINYYKKIGYEVYKNTEIDNIKSLFKDNVCVFTGQSGAGKSTLLNKLDIKLNIKTGETSKALGRGRHTTRHTELISINDGLVADTPGFSALSFDKMTKLDIRDNFKDFNIYRDMCKYKDCLHDKEDNCIIKDKVNSSEILKSRYENYIKFIHNEK